MATAYLWSTETQIQEYLDARSGIKIGTDPKNFSPEQSMELENLAVLRITASLRAGYMDLPTDNAMLQDLAAKLTASYIGSSRQGSVMGQAVAAWCIVFKNEVFRELAEILYTHRAIEGATTIACHEWRRLIAWQNIMKNVVDDKVD